MSLFSIAGVFGVVCLVILGARSPFVHSLNNGLALTPPMGWMTWQRFRCITDCQIFPNDCISEQLIKRTALAMKNNGYLEAGYEYIVIDDCWSERERDPITKKLIPDKKRFPSGLEHLGEYIHSLGLKFGLYQDFGTHTCGGYPGIIGYEEIDAQSFADWGVDYVKLDGCYSDINDMDEGYPRFGALLNKTGRPMVYSCSWPVYQEENGKLPNFTLIQEHCNLWRNWDDIDDSWASVNTILQYFSNPIVQARISPNAGPGHWNDPDMLLIGNFGLSVEQSRAQMAVWAILAAPLLMSNDLDNIGQEFREILLNRDIIAVNQDSLGIQGVKVLTVSNIQVWTRPLKSEKNTQFDYAVAFVSLRTDGQPYRINVKLDDIKLINQIGFKVSNLYDSTEETRIVKSDIDVIVNPSGCRFYKFISL